MRTVRDLVLPNGSIDEPTYDQVLSDEPFLVRGWALLASEPVARVDLLIDGHPVAARLGLPRTDVAARSRLPDAILSGFEHLVDPREVGGERFTIGGVVRGTQGSTHTLPTLPVHARFLASIGEGPAPIRERTPRRRWPRRPRGRPPRLVLVTHTLERGGASIVAADLVRVLRERYGFHSEVVAPSNGPLAEELDAAGIPVHEVGGYPIETPEAYEEVVGRIMDVVRTSRCDIVLSNTLVCVQGVDAGLRCGLPVAWMIHEEYTPRAFWASYYAPRRLHASVRERAVAALRGASVVTFNAESTRRLYLGNVASERTRIIRYGIDLREIDQHRVGTDRPSIRRRLGLPEDAFLILSVGSIEPRKCQALTARAFGLVARERPSARLVLLGDHGSPYSAAITEFLDRSGLRSRSQLLPFTVPHDWYAAADLLVSASDIESGPLAIFQAMAHGTPILATPVGDMGRVLEDGRTGYLVPERDLGALVEGLRRVLATPEEERNAVGRAGERVVRTAHGLDRYAADYAWILGGMW